MEPRLRLACLLLFASPTVLAAGDPATDWTERIVAEESETRIRPVGTTRFALSHPYSLSARVGTVLSRQPAAFDCSSTCDHVGPVFQVEAGNGGAQLSAGYARVIGDRRREGFLLSDVYVGFGIKGALLRTWGDTERKHRHLTYVGAEGEFTITNVNLSVGFFRRVSGEGSDHRWLTTLGVGWGF